MSLDPSHSRTAFASSRVLDRLRRSPPVRLGDSGADGIAPARSARPPDHVSRGAHRGEDASGDRRARHVWRATVNISAPGPRPCWGLAP